MQSPFKNAGIVYQIMHMEETVAEISDTGKARIISEQFMPYDLYLDEEEAESYDIDLRLNNLNNFYHWCASRVLSLDRKYAKEILNSIGAAQAVTDRDRADISLSYHCVSLTDVFWVRKKGEDATFRELNLYDNSLNEAVVEISLKGRQMTVTNRELAPDLSTKGCFPKAWIRDKEGFRLLKDGDGDAVRRELLASRICQCFDIPQVIYEEGCFEGEPVTRSGLITSKERSMVSKMAFDIYACNHGLDTLDVCRSIDPNTYYGMNILDYLTGNTDRHPENWGFFIDNSTNKYFSLYPVMDFNQCFLSYDDLEGANCQTVLPDRMTQREAAVEAVRKIGLRQIKEVDMSIFGSMKKEAEMFSKRLAELRRYVPDAL
ncbi:MAG TPA: hypothetical protein H9765_08010 [Candidatus Mediterraneibacter intestinigallinarum]|nr:hypothetical protein [Candidatus Mediterraneibacter intestinigallinarum]